MKNYIYDTYQADVNHFRETYIQRYRDGKTFLNVNHTNSEILNCFRWCPHAFQSTMVQQRLKQLSLMSIEDDIVSKISFTDVIDDFATRKLRKQAKQFTFVKI